MFGAFLFGACLPRDDRLLETLVERIEHVAILVLMPVFFALAGLSTTTSAFTTTGLPALLLILAAAVAGKILGAGGGARHRRAATGAKTRKKCKVGSPMNARTARAGWSSCIVMKVGLDAGVIGFEIFTMLMVMAIVDDADVHRPC